MAERALEILDGGMGRELQRRGAPFRQPEWSALALSEAPEAVIAVHTAYIEAGAGVILLCCRTIRAEFVAYSSKWSKLLSALEGGFLD